MAKKETQTATIPVVEPTSPDNEVQPPRASDKPRQGRKFPCPKCGAKLDFDPASQALACPYCGHLEKIAESQAEVQELDYDDYLGRLAGSGKALEGHTSQCRCTGCGATILLEDKVATESCPFCSTHLESNPETVKGLIEPEGILPFAIEERDARKRFNSWVEGLWFAPSALKNLANLGEINGVYLPFWTYDSMTNSHYTGARGTNYTTVEYYTDYESFSETDSNGNTVTRSRPVQRQRTVVQVIWTPAAGQVRHFFDDVLVCATHSLSELETRSLAPWDLDKVEPFQAPFLSGFKTERYAVNLPEGFEKAKAIMDRHISELCRRDIGGDHQRVDSVRTQFMGITFKHLLMPTWMGVYRFQNEPYRVLVNARTGQVFGRRPYSVAKITTLVLVILAVLAIVGLIIWKNQQGRGRSGSIRFSHVLPSRASLASAPPVSRESSARNWGTFPASLRTHTPAPRPRWTFGGQRRV